MSYNKTQAKDTISRPPASEDEITDIVKRLYSAHTKSSKGAPCKEPDTPKPQGYGLKMYPVIDGIETRFKCQGSKGKEEVGSLTERLHKTQTKASSARLDYPRILLYPERTSLMNNTERIVAYQQSGAVSTQQELQRRERWYN